MCVDFIDLNKVCLKDSFLLLIIDRLIDAFTGHKILNFMDVFSGYNQISLNLPDQEKMTFNANEGLYCYRAIPFELKNTRATYQRLVNKVFTYKIGRTIEVYVDDMMVKNSTMEQHIRDLLDTFVALRLYNMKLNLEKCTFEVEERKFLGFIGFVSNPEKIQVILDMPQPRSIRDI